MPARFALSFSKKLFLYFFITGLLLTLLAAVLTVQHSSAQARDGMREQTRSGVQSAAVNLDALLNRCADGIRGLAEDKTVVNYLQGTKGVSRYDIAHTVYLTANGLKPGVSVFIKRLSDHEIVSAGEVSPVFEDDHYKPEYTMLRRFFDSEDVGIYTTVKGINMQRSTRIVLGKVIRDAGAVPLGLIAMEIGRDALAEVVSGFSFVSTRPILVIDHFSTVLFNSQHEAEEGLGKMTFQSDFSPLWQQAALTGSFHEENIVWHKVRFANYAVVGEVPQDLVTAVQSSARRAILPVFVLVFSLSALFSYLITRHVSSPIKQLTLAMSEVEKGNFNALVPVVGHDEIGRLSTAFNQMQREIHELIERNKEKQRNLRIAEVNALSLQVNPHFLYNVLDLIKWSIKLERYEQSVQMIVQLGNLLRMLMNNTGDTVTVAGEMRIVQAYLDIQRFRWQDRLTVEFDIEQGLETYVIPKLMLQPLIENAIIHGLEDRPEGGSMKISGHKDGDYLHFCVEDSGRGMSPEKLDQVRQAVPDGMYHIGLSNLHQRARLFGDERCGLEINSILGQGTSIHLTVKAETKERKGNV